MLQQKDNNIAEFCGVNYVSARAVSWVTVVYFEIPMRSCCMYDIIEADSDK